VGVDVDAPVGALAAAQHADGAVLLFERDHSACSGSKVLLLVGILDDGVVLEEVSQRDGHALEETDTERPLALSKELVAIDADLARIEIGRRSGGASPGHDLGDLLPNCHGSSPQRVGCVKDPRAGD
jgi:hypothetical protein